MDQWLLQEFDSMPSDFTLVADLSRVGMTGCMWSNARIPQGEDNLYKFVRLSSNPWFDERLVRIAKVRHGRHNTTQHTLSIPLSILSCIVHPLLSYAAIRTSDMT